jgi:DNA invertase Pin-like site-specific DNA recombinase
VLYGYARASVDSETLDDQEAALNAAGCFHVFKETDSRKRPQLAQTIQTAGFGDVVMVTSLDRLARSAADLFAVYSKLSEHGAGVQSLAEAITDPATPQGRYFADFVAWCAVFDAVTFAERMHEGRTLAKAKGVKLGPRFKTNQDQQREIKKIYSKGSTMTELASQFGVSQSAIWRIINR